MSGPTSRRERKVVTVVFCDLVGFTARAESLDPEDVEAFLRPYHERVRAVDTRFYIAQIESALVGVQSESA